MKPKLLQLLQQCVEVGAQRGWNRAHKYKDNPDERAILDEIENCIMGELFEWFDFEENELGK